MSIKDDLSLFLLFGFIQLEYCGFFNSTIKAIFILKNVKATWLECFIIPP